MMYTDICISDKVVGSMKEVVMGNRKGKSIPEVPKWPQKPAVLYAQELLNKGKILNIRLSKDYRTEVNEETNLAAELGMEILRIYDNASQKSVRKPTPDGRRWKYLADQLGREFDESQKIAQALGMTGNYASDCKLLHEERRAGIAGVCRAICALGIWKGSVEALEQRFAGTGEVEWKEDGQTGDKEETEPGREETPQDKEKEEQEALIRKAGKPFGYYLPRKEDDEARVSLFRALIGEVRDRGMELERFLALTDYRIDTLRELDRNWSQNANKLHVIIAAGRKGDDAESIKKIYRAFALQPVGWENLQHIQTQEEEKAALVLPADQIVYTGIRYFRPLMDCVDVSRAEEIKNKPMIFWSLLYGLLDYYDNDESTYKRTKLKLCGQLFYKPDKDTLITDLTEYFVNDKDGEMFDPREGFDPKKAVNPARAKEEKVWYLTGSR